MTYMNNEVTTKASKQRLEVHKPRPIFFETLTITQIQIFMQSYSRLMQFKVKDLMIDKRRLVEVPDNATLGDALNTMVNHG